jgi:cephalosporin hydroxylase
MIVNSIFEACEGRRNLVILDSYHSYDHVREEMKLYYPLVPVGSYLIVEDTHVSGHPVPWEHGKGPYEACENFLNKHPNWSAEHWCEKYMMTFNPNGYLKRIQ